LLLEPSGDIAEIAALVEAKQLFQLDATGSAKQVATLLVEPVSQLNQNIKRFSGGALSGETMIFLLLLGFGAYELLRGGFRRPPWYTAFWYAFGLYTKSIVDRQAKE
jgi:hypothetical protein